MFEIYKKKINQIEKFYNQGDTENTILGCGKLIEHIVSVLFSEFHLYLKSPEERKLFLELKIQWQYRLIMIS